MHEFINILICLSDQNSLTVNITSKRLFDLSIVGRPLKARHTESRGHLVEDERQLPQEARNNASTDLLLNQPALAPARRSYIHVFSITASQKRHC
jgi:hypothetical protein